MPFSPVGKKKVAAHIGLWLCNLLVLAFSAKVNHFQEFFFVADLFPFALSIICLVTLTVMIGLDFASSTSYTGRPQFELGVFGVLSIFWLAFNAFSTSRWRHVTMSCGAIPDAFSDARGWCKDLQALKAFVWIEWVMFLLTTIITLRYVITQNSRGNTHIFKMPLSRYKPRDLDSDYGTRNSEFLQYNNSGYTY
ncbi:hypothetical protein K435DRAFT_271220 [Dendrothele bispora CBS 962.96]|uniref:MARVEL domain-containing protein n=1 Tax=Dendrothele bispora (strain CBS 962.96) TaxID=1314807 RepID=A0A4S8LMB0_DENBC|nr:hypothetical protein K435DRAFT_271220 [Dendrothele bispora CBS 962.96]